MSNLLFSAVSCVLLVWDVRVVPRSAAARGTCRVMCFSPKSNVTIPLMSQVRLGMVWCRV